MHGLAWSMNLGTWSLSHTALFKKLPFPFKRNYDQTIIQYWLKHDNTNGKQVKLIWRMAIFSISPVSHFWLLLLLISSAISTAISILKLRFSKIRDSHLWSPTFFPPMSHNWLIKTSVGNLCKTELERLFQWHLKLMQGRDSAFE